MTNFTFVVVCIICLNQIGIISGRCLYGDEPSCTFPCHCAVKDECGTECLGGCAAQYPGGDLSGTWNGPACQIGNVASGLKTASHSGTTFQASSGSGYIFHPWRALDGLLAKAGRAGAIDCAIQTESPSPAIWTVDLGNLYYVNNVTLYNRHTHIKKNVYLFQLSDVIITVKNGSTSGTQCGVYKSIVPVGNNPEDGVTVTCNPPIIGDTVQIARQLESRGDDILTICEAIITGHKYVYIDCSQCPSESPCSDIIGCSQCNGAYQPNCQPVDHNRVILEKGNEEDSDQYINANYITGYQKPQEYIATQGPKNTTLKDFWKMVWQENANRIIMLTNLEELGKTRCSAYWPKPPETTKIIGCFKITTDKIETTADYTTTALTLKKGSESRTVRHFHFTTWEDKNKPMYGPGTLLDFLRKVHSDDRSSRGPMVVHCSAGVGRTGTFIALDILKQQVEQEDKVDVYKCVHNLRKERMFMVQTRGQYVFLHKALAEVIKYKNTSYSCTSFESEYQTLFHTYGPKDKSEIDRQFQLLCSWKSTNGSVPEQPDGLKDDNKLKNRTLNIIPADNHRPFLPLGLADNNYINAVYVDSFKEHDFYIVTQMPLPATIADFWGLVLDKNCHTIVMLNMVENPDEIYWPVEQDSTERYGYIEVRNEAERANNPSKSIMIRDLTLHNTKSKRGMQDRITVKQFQLMTWPNDKELPPNKEDILDLLDLLQKWLQQQHVTEVDKGKVLVHCIDGGCHSGLFCGVGQTLNRIKTEQEVSAFQTVRCVARTRPQFFQTLHQYKFLYDLSFDYLSQFNQYVNYQ